MESLGLWHLLKLERMGLRFWVVDEQLKMMKPLLFDVVAVVVKANDVHLLKHLRWCSLC